MRETIFEPARNDLIEQFRRAHDGKHNTPWRRRWLNFAFLVRTVMLFAACLRPAIWAALLTVAAQFVPAPVKRWLLGQFR